VLFTFWSTHGTEIVSEKSQGSHCYAHSNIILQTHNTIINIDGYRKPKILLIHYWLSSKIVEWRFAHRNFFAWFGIISDNPKLCFFTSPFRV